jgi:hypothetical protein
MLKLDENADYVPTKEPKKPESHVYIHPNPVSDVANFRLPDQVDCVGTLHLKVFDVFGRTVLQRTMACPEDQVQFNGLTNGFYTYIVLDDKNNSLGSGVFVMKKEGQ